MPPSPPFGMLPVGPRDSVDEFVDQLLERLLKRGLMRRTGGGMVQLTPAAVAKVGYRLGDDLSEAFGRLAAMVELEMPDVP